MRDSALRIAGFAACLLLAGAQSAETAQGYFHMGENRLELHYAIAVQRERGDAADAPETLVFLSDQPLDAANAAAAFDPDDAVRGQVGDRPGGYLRLCLRPDGGECGLFYARNAPSDSFNTSGYGELRLDKPKKGRISGRWVLAEPVDFMGQAYDFDLRFDAPLTPAPGTALPPGGDAPGAAYAAFLTALGQDDVDALRSLAGEDGDWRFPRDNAVQCRDSLKALRDGQPLQAEVARGRLDGEQAILWVDGRDRGGIHRRGRVLMRHGAQGWYYADSDLAGVDE